MGWIAQKSGVGEEETQVLKSVIDVLRDRRLNGKVKKKVEPAVVAKKIDHEEQQEIAAAMEADDDDE